MEIFLSFQGSLSKMYSIYRNSDKGGFEILDKSGMFSKKCLDSFLGASLMIREGSHVCT